MRSALQQLRAQAGDMAIKAQAAAEAAAAQRSDAEAAAHQAAQELAAERKALAKLKVHCQISQNSLFPRRSRKQQFFLVMVRRWCGSVVYSANAWWFS